MDGHVTYANLTGAKILGVSRIAILGRHVRELDIPEDSVAPFLAAAEKVFRTGERTVADTPWESGNGVKQYRCSVSPLHATTRRINAADIMFHDIGHETRIEEELEQCRTQVSGLLLNPPRRDIER